MRPKKREKGKTTQKPSTVNGSKKQGKENKNRTVRNAANARVGKKGGQTE